MAYRIHSPSNSFFIASNNDQLERAQAQVARTAATRRKLTTFASPFPPPDPCLSKQQIIDLFQNCIKLAAENKINQKNSWELKLIDHLSEIIKVASDADTNTNFQKASYTLEAGVKIYSVRVDAVHSEACKVLDGFSRASLEDEPEAITEGDNVKLWQDRSHFKKDSEKISPLSSLESSLEALNVKMANVVFALDHLYHHTSAQFDEGGAKGLLLNNLGVYGGCQVLFDSLEVPGRCKSCLQNNDILDMIDISFAKESIKQMEVNMLEKNDICPILRDIICQFDKDNQRSSEAVGIGLEFDVRSDVFDTREVEMDKTSFGNFEVWAYNNDNGMRIFQESFTKDSTLLIDYEENYLCMSSKPDVDHSFENVTEFLLQGFGNTSKQNMWAGRDHWKFQKFSCQNNVSVAKSGCTTKRQKRKYEAEDDIDFMKSLDRKRVDIFAPPRSLKSLLLPAKQAPCSSALPENCHYQPENLVKLFLLPNVVCSVKKRRELSDNKSWQQKNDFDEASPSWGINECVYSSQYDDGYFEGVEDADEIVAQPQQVNKIEFLCDKTSKRVDVLALKEVLWNHIQESFGIPQTVCKDVVSFRHILAMVPVECRAAAAEDISPHLCFICLLHLANEHGLSIQDCQSLDDLSIHLPPTGQNMDGVVQFSS